MDSNFQRSWSVYGHRSVDNNDYFQSQSNLQRTMSTRITKMNLEKRFNDVNNETEGLTIPSNRPYFWKNNQQGNQLTKPFNKLKFRSVTDTNLQKLGLNDFGKGFHKFNSPKSSYHRQSLRQLPDRLGPVWTNFQNNVNQAGPKTEKFIQKGGEKLSKAIEGVRTTINTLSQRFKKSTRRHYKLDSTPTRTPGRTPNRNLITPGKLYSPFEMNTPRTPHSYSARGPKRLQYGHNSRRQQCGKENYALCRTPPPQTFKSDSCPVIHPDWVEFNSPRLPPRVQHDPPAHYRMDSSYCQTKGAPVCPPELYWQ